MRSTVSHHLDAVARIRHSVAVLRGEQWIERAPTREVLRVLGEVPPPPLASQRPANTI
jgi:hypothetical protein